VVLCYCKDPRITQVKCCTSNGPATTAHPKKGGKQQWDTISMTSEIQSKELLK
jgi:hypothetical protein